MHTYRLILEGKLTIPLHVSANTEAIVKGLLRPSATKRLGCLRNGAADVRQHVWFAGLNVPQLLRMKLPTPYTPKVLDPMDTSNFPKYTEQPDEPYVDDGTGWDAAF